LGEKRERERERERKGERELAHVIVETGKSRRLDTQERNLELKSETSLETNFLLTWG
jgi:hypothetical protein